MGMSNSTICKRIKKSRFFEEGNYYMSRVENKNSTRTLLYTALVLGMVAIAFCFVLTTDRQVDAKSDKSTDTASVAPSATFPADAPSLGAIPDSNIASPVCQNNSTTFRDVTFTVTGLPGNVTSASVSFSASHTFLQDLEVSLRGPGGSPSHLLFALTGTTTTVANSCAGSSNDLSTANTYTFADTAAANWWTTAATNPVPTSSNRSVVTGPTTNPPATTTINTTFASTPANGTWSLRFRDRGAGDTGTVTAASLTLTAGVVAPVQHVVDYDGDGRTDASVVRNTGGGPTGQVTWFNLPANAGPHTVTPWGQATDFFVPEDYDGDNKTDIAIWRPGAPFNAFFYILQSSTSTLRGETFGQTGDDPTVVGDYNGDGSADLAVYRAGAASGDPSNWYWRQTANGPVFNRQWGQNGDFPTPGDYDGDAKNDFGVQRNAGGGQAAFHIFNTLASNYTVTVFGTPTDVVTPGDWDGDGKTDIATIRGISGQINWFYLPSSGGPYVLTPWGASATDFPTQGDYDGDGKTDHAIWRPSADPLDNNFWIRNSNGGTVTKVEWGQNGDYPVANFNVH
jgi:subtilisin-like proprotein convertase family protein